MTSTKTGRKSALYTINGVYSFTKQLTSMLNNHPDRPEVEVELIFDTSEAGIKVPNQKVRGHVNNGDKIVEKIYKLATLEGFRGLLATVEQQSENKYTAIIKV